MTKVLLTGGSGFIAAHCLEQLLAKGHKVVTTVRSEDKAQRIREAYADKADDLDVVIVPDIARADAFDEVAKTPGLEVVLHTASPFHFNFKDPQKELLDPAIIGTTSILKALKRSAPSVRRVVVTSSFASIVDEAHTDDPNTTYTEASWNPVTAADIHKSPATAYRASKKLAEQAAWAFVRDEQPGFDLVTVCPPMVFGPVAPAHHLASLDAINTSNERVVALLRGAWRGAGAVPPVGLAVLWVDVRDVARAHVLAGLERPAAGGRRLFVTAGWFCNRDIVDVVRRNFPEFADRLPGPEVEGGEMPDLDKWFRFDNSETNKVLGFEWIPLEKSVTDLVKKLKELGV